MINPIQIKVGSRASALAQIQVKEISELLSKHQISFEFDHQIFESGGDQNKKISLRDPSIPDNFFTDVLDDAVLNRDLDVTIHSAKDLPQILAPGLQIFALTKSADSSDAFLGKSDFVSMPDGAKIGTSSSLRREQILKLNPKLEALDIRGTIQDRIDLLENGVYDGIIVATIALKRLGLESKIQNIMPWEGFPSQGQLAVVGRSDDLKLQELFSKIDCRREYGKVSLVGAGPGDPELITQKAIRVLNEADIIFYDYLVNTKILDYAPQAEHVCVGKRKGQHSMPQSELSRLLRDTAFQGKRIVRLKGGDPFIFGRGADEMTMLLDFHIPLEIIPGVNSATAISSTLGLPLTARGVSRSVSFLTGHGAIDQDPDLTTLNLEKTETLVFFMGLTKLDQIVSLLRKKQWAEETPILVISRGTCYDEQLVRGKISNIFEKVQKAELQQPALVIIGQTIKFYDRFIRQQSNTLYTGLFPEKYCSTNVIHFPMIEIKPHKMDLEKISEIKNKWDEYTKIILTSRFGVKYFVDFCQNNGMSLEDKKFILVGLETAKELHSHGFESFLISENETSEGLFDAMKQNLDLKSEVFLFPRSSLPNPYLKEKLIESGSSVDELKIYENIKPEKRLLPHNIIDSIIFTSPSTVTNFCEDYSLIPNHWTVFAKGQKTQQFLSEHGVEALIV